MEAFGKVAQELRTEWRLGMLHIKDQSILGHFFSNSSCRHVPKIIVYPRVHTSSLTALVSIWFCKSKTEKVKGGGMSANLSNYCCLLSITVHSTPPWITNVWFIKNWTTHNLSLWLYEYFWIMLLYGHLVYFIIKHEKFAIWIEDLPKES